MVWLFFCLFFSQLCQQSCACSASWNKPELETANFCSSEVSPRKPMHSFFFSNKKYLNSQTAKLMQEP